MKKERFIGYYDYTMVLTYASLLSAGLGIVLSLSGDGRPYAGALCLMISGLCDAFDGMVARTKKNRTEREMHYGIQVDSLADVVAFGVLPGCMGVAVLRTSPVLSAAGGLVRGLLTAVCLCFMLCALIRLAYFNVLEEERRQTETGKLKAYTGLPVTAACLIFPAVLLVRAALPGDASWLYFVFLALTGTANVSSVKIKKPGLKGLLVMVAAGVLLAVTALLLLRRRG